MSAEAAPLVGPHHVDAAAIGRAAGVAQRDRHAVRAPQAGDREGPPAGLVGDEEVPAEGLPAVERLVEHEPEGAAPAHVDLPLRTDRGDRSLHRVVVVLGVPFHVAHHDGLGPALPRVGGVGEEDPGPVGRVVAPVPIELGPGQVEPPPVDRIGQVRGEPGLVLVLRGTQADALPVVEAGAAVGGALHDDAVDEEALGLGRVREVGVVDAPVGVVGDRRVAPDTEGGCQELTLGPGQSRVPRVVEEIEVGADDQPRGVRGVDGDRHLLGPRVLRSADPDVGW